MNIPALSIQAEVVQSNNFDKEELSAEIDTQVIQHTNTISVIMNRPGELSRAACFVPSFMRLDIS